MKNVKDNIFDLQLFSDLNTQTTHSDGLSDEMKVYYSDYLIDNALPKLVHDQFAQKHPIPKNGGKIIEFRKYSPLPKLLSVLQEGVTPDGQSLTVTTITSEVRQYGGYVTLSDILMLTAIDNNLVQATKLLGNQAGATLDTITREVMNGGTNVIYSGGDQPGQPGGRQRHRSQQLLPDRGRHQEGCAGPEDPERRQDRRQLCGHHPPRRGL